MFQIEQDHYNEFHNFCMDTIEDFLDIHGLCRARNISIHNNDTSRSLDASTVGCRSQCHMMQNNNICTRRRTQKEHIIRVSIGKMSKLQKRSQTVIIVI